MRKKKKQTPPRKLAADKVASPPDTLRNFRLAIAVVTVLSAVFHFTGLYHPYAVIFDEFHFGKFVSAYTHSGIRIFDIHPPHSKLLIALGAKLGGYTGQFGFRHIGEPFIEGVGVETLRWMPAIWGTLIPVLVFLILSSLGASVLWCFTGAAVALLDNGLLLQTRIIALDGSLILFTLVSVYAVIRGLNAFRSWPWMFLAGAAGALTVGTKYTGLVAPVLMGAVLLFLPKWQKKESSFRPGLWRAGVFIFAFALVFCAGWAVHFHLLTKPGYADRFYTETGNFWVDMFQLQERMLSANAGITQGHPDQSKWWEWIFDRKAPFYWEGRGNRIYFVGNPAIWFFCSLAVFYLTQKWFRRERMSVWENILVLGFWMSWLPYAFVSRALFLYHFLPPLIFAILAIFLHLGTKPWKNRRAERGALLGVFLLALFGFWLVAPWTFGTPPTQIQEDFLRSHLLKSAGTP